ncbi:unnamed protein product [Zymoseptoria tritici ST99CH_3D1]|nr:unnamed protein product [Zymoseptoria tritici ST99CH_3D1]
MPPMATLPPDREDSSASRKIKYQHQEDDVPVVANLISLDRTGKNVHVEEVVVDHRQAVAEIQEPVSGGVE